MESYAVQERWLTLSELHAEQFREWLKYWNIRSVLQQVFSVRRDSVIAENLPILAILAVYVIAVYAVHIFWGIHDKIVLTCYYGLFARVAAVFSALFILWHIPKRAYLRYLTPRHIGGFLVIFLAAPLAKSIYSSYKQTIWLIHDFRWDASLMRLDKALHFGHHPWQLLDFILSHPIILYIFDRLYMLWFLILFLSCLYMAWSDRRQLRLCFFVSTLLIWIVVGSGLGTIFSSVGPCYYSAVANAAHDPYAPLVTKLAEIHKTTFLYAVDNQHLLWEAKLEGYWIPLGGISAMPSIHLAMTMLFVLLAFHYSKWLGFLFTGYLCAIQIGSIVLGWHYAVDGYAGMILACLIWMGVKWMVCGRKDHAAESGA
jgi:hypothetical protein